MLEIPKEERFKAFFSLLMQLEGGFCNHKNDKGDKTNFGITERTLRIYNSSIRIEDLTQKIAQDIYLTMYYKQIPIPISTCLHYHYFDICVNSGYSNYKKCRDIITNDLSKITPWRTQFYNQIVAHDPSQKVFLKGWLNRIDRINKSFHLS